MGVLSLSIGSFAQGYYDVGAQLPDYLRREAQACFDRDREEKDRLRSVPAFEERRSRLKGYFDRLIGGLPKEKTPLNASCMGILDRGEYEIRKIVYASLPGVYVTANLYVPKAGEGPYPAVVFACGHTEAGKAVPAYQKVCIELVRNGIIALAVDPISQGERSQSYDRAAGRPLVRWHAEHTYLSLQCELAGSHIVRYFTWDLIRSVDYLLSLPIVDGDKIGVTGNSGGGIQTIMAMIADPRIAAAAPCTYISSREAYMKTGQPQDGEQIWDGAIEEGMDYDDYLTLFAPKPVLIGGVESDFFCIEGTYASCARAKEAYALFGRADNVTLGMAKGTHAFNDELRGIVVDWFAKQFHGKAARPPLGNAMATEPAATLQCTVGGQVLAEYADARSVQADNAGLLPALKERLAQLEGQPDRLAAEVADWLRMPVCDAPILPRVIQADRESRAGCLMDRAFERETVLFFSEPDIMVGGVYVQREGDSPDRTTVLLTEEGTNGLAMENDRLVQLTEYGRVFAFDPRGTGGFKSRPVNARDYDTMFGTEYKLGCDARMLGRPLAGMRTFDAIRALDYAERRNPGTKLGLAGQGFAAIYALLAGVIDDRVDEILVENLPRSFADIVNDPCYAYDVRLHWHGVLRHFDLPELVSAFAERKRIRVASVRDVGHIVRF